jgi:hypothetical protein
MNASEEEMVYEQKMDQVTEQLEELILDALLKALKKIKQRNLTFEDLFRRAQNQLNQF